MKANVSDDSHPHQLTDRHTQPKLLILMAPTGGMGPMRQLYFLVPGTSGKFRCGGLWAELNTLKLAQQVCDAELVTYRQREPETLFLDDLLHNSRGSNAIFVVSWGFDVAKLVARLKDYAVVYHAH